MVGEAERREERETKIETERWGRGRGERKSDREKHREIKFEREVG